MLQFFSAIPALKECISLVAALAELAHYAQKDEEASIKEVLLKLRIDALRGARAIDRTIDELVQELGALNVDVNETFRQADTAIARWHLLKKGKLGSITQSFGSILTTMKSFYSDVTSILTCSERYEAVGSGLDRAYEIRRQLDEISLDVAPIINIIELLRNVNGNLLKRLEG